MHFSAMVSGYIFPIILLHFFFSIQFNSIQYTSIHLNFLFNSFLFYFICFKTLSIFELFQIVILNNFRPECLFLPWSWVISFSLFDYILSFQFNSIQFNKNQFISISYVSKLCQYLNYFRLSF